jgi:hypothetical protein
MSPIGPTNTVLSALSRVSEARASSDVNKARSTQTAAALGRAVGPVNLDAAREAARAAFASIARTGAAPAAPAPAPERPVPTPHPQGPGKIHPRGTFLNITV